MAVINDVLTWIKRDALSILLLLLPNIILIYAVLFQGLDATYVILTFWSESAVIGFYTLLRILFAKGSPDQLPDKYAIFLKLFLMAFFVVHFGLFMFVHLMFILAYMSFANFEFAWSTTVLFAPLLCVVAFFLSHGVEFGIAIKNRELEALQPQEVMFAPYGRIVLMQVIIIFGFFMLRWIGFTMILVSALVMLKGLVDIVLAWRRHSVNRP